MEQTRIRRVFAAGVLAAIGSAFLAAPAWAQAPRADAPTASPAQAAGVGLPDAQRTRNDLTQLLDGYPPTVRGVFAFDPGLLSNKAYLAAYPALATFLDSHPEVARNPTFYVGNPPGFAPTRNRADEIWGDMLSGLAVFLGFGMAIGLVTWLIRTFIDYRRWIRLAKVQTDVHTKLLDRFTGHEELLAYIQSPAGAKFLESSPISLDAGPRSMGAPLGRILLSVQAGLVLVAAGVGMWLVSVQIPGDASQPFHAMGILGVALGVGFVLSAIISFMISSRLGLIEQGPAARVERPSA